MERIQCGLMGEKLGHSRSPEIHAQLGDYEYRLYEIQKDEIEEFIQNGSWRGMNVTIPYKKAVVPFLNQLSPVAERIGSVNTIIRRQDGTLFGDNTDVYGFEALVRFSGFRMTGRKTLILGSGGASASVREALIRIGSVPTVISRSGENNYDNLEKHQDAAFVVNTTPVGMFPDTDASPLDLKRLPDCQGLLDIIYNPLRTKLMAQAEELGMPANNGLYMLVAQAWRAAELFTGTDIPESCADAIYRRMAK